MTFGEKIKEARKSQKLTLQDLSKKSGLSAITISHIEKNNHKPSSLSVMKLCRALDLNYDELWDLSTR